VPRVSTWLATLGVVALAGAGVVGWLVLRGNDSEGAAPAAPPPPPVVVTHQGPPKLELPKHGHPIVWVKQGEKLAIHTSPGGPVARWVGAHTKFGEPMVFSIVKQRGRWAGAPSPYLGNHSLAWFQLDPHRLKAATTRFEIRVDLSDYRATLRSNDRVVRAFSVTIGAAGTETPTGRFATTDEFVGTLNSSAYGCCALALTARQQHQLSGWMGGDRIAIHGTVGPLGIAASHGCIRASNPDVHMLQKTVPLGTPVIVRN
jgi:L,D-transpeptidase-like protein